MLKSPSINSKRRRKIQGWSLCLSDMLSFVLSVLIVSFGYITALNHNGHISRITAINFNVIGLLALVWILGMGLIKHRYVRRTSFWDELHEILMGIMSLALFHLAVMEIFGQQIYIVWWFTTWMLIATLTPLLRQLTKRFLLKLNIWQIPTIIIGEGENAKSACLALKCEKMAGLEVQGFISKRHLNGSRVLAPVEGIPLLCMSDHGCSVNAFADYYSVIALESNESNEIETWVRQLSFAGAEDIFVIPPMPGIPLIGMEIKHFFTHEALVVRLHNNLANQYSKVMKRWFDITFSLLLIIILSPLFALLIWKITRDAGPAIFGHVRVGQRRKPFKCLKFRSMVCNADNVLKELIDNDSEARAEWEECFKLKNDPRITCIGNFLRKTSLDELPQLWNVLKGEMSLVGPRPVVVDELKNYGNDVEYYLMAKPGMTGIWQISGRNDVDYDTRVKMDSWYVKNWSLWSDIVIILKTIPVVVGRNGAY